MEVKSEGGTAERGPFRTIQKRHVSLDSTTSGQSPEQYETSDVVGCPCLTNRIDSEGDPPK